jgi:small neutral amino acid transporter SnatA (MarC family)
MKLPDPRRMLVDDSVISDEEFRKQNLVNVISSAILMIAGPLFMYYGFYLLTWPYTVKWGALSIAIGFFVLIFGFSLWQDRQVQVLQRMYRKDAAEIKGLLRELKEERK